MTEATLFLIVISASFLGSLIAHIVYNAFGDIKRRYRMWRKKRKTKKEFAMPKQKES